MVAFLLSLCFIQGNLMAKEITRPVSLVANEEGGGYLKTCIVNNSEKIVVIKGFPYQSGHVFPGQIGNDFF